MKTRGRTVDGVTIPPAVLEAFGFAVAALAAHMAASIVEERSRETLAPKFATSKNNPLGNSRKFLEAGRRKAFPMHRVGRDNVALWADVEAWMQSCPEPKKKPRDEDDIDAAELLARSMGKRRARG